MNIRTSRAARAVRLVAVLSAALLSVPAQAAARADIYQVLVPVPERSEGGQAAAFSAAMKVLLVRVTGRRGAGDEPAMAPIVADARRYVQQFRVASDGQVAVSFDGGAVDRWLAQNGQPIWGRERPATFVWLALPATGTQPAAVARGDDPSDLRAAVDAEAQLRGIPLRWPTAAELQAHHVDYAMVAGGPTATLVDIAERLGGEGVLIGRPGASGSTQWQYQFQGRSAGYTGTTDGVDGAADTYAGLFAASGAPASLDIDVDGVGDVASYAKVQGYFESLSFVAHVDVRAVEPDRLQLRLAVRGGAAALQRAIALDGVLVPQGAAEGTALHYALRP